MGDCCREGDEFTAKDDAEAMRWYHLAAEQGLPEAKNNIGAMYHNGIGVPKDAAEAARWYKLAADQGLGIAQNNLGLLYQAGLGVEANAEEALRLFKAAAQRGEVMAQIELSRMYHESKGTAPDLMEAAADVGDMTAQYEMGRMFRSGSGIPADLAKAAKYFILAARQGDVPSKRNLSDIEHALKELAISIPPTKASQRSTRPSSLRWRLAKGESSTG